MKRCHLSKELKEVREWLGSNVEERSRNCKGTEIEEDLASLRNSGKTNGAGTELVQESIVGSRIREVKVARLSRSW